MTVLHLMGKLDEDPNADTHRRQEMGEQNQALLYKKLYEYNK